MADSFNLIAELVLRGPTNLEPTIKLARKQIEGGLRNIQIGIDAKSATQQLNQVTSSLKAVETQTKKATKATDTVSTATAKVANQAKHASSSMEVFGHSVFLATKRLTAYTIAASAMLSGFQAIRTGLAGAIEFERELVKVAQVSGKTMAELKGLSDTITKLSTTYGVSANELAKVTKTLSQAGIRGTELTAVLETLSRTTLAATFGDINKTTEGTIAIIRQFNMSGHDMERVLGSINEVAGDFAVSADDVVAAVRRAGGVFAAAGGTFNEFLSLFTAIRSTTRESAETIATGIRTISTRLQRMRTIRFLRQFNIDLLDTQGNFVGVFKAFQELSKRLKAIPPTSPIFAQIAEEIGGFRQIGKTIPGILNFTVALQALQAAQRGETSLAEDAAKAQQTLAVQIQKTKEEFMALVREIVGDTSFRELVKTLLSTASAFIRVASSIKEVLPALLAIGAIKIFAGAPSFVRGFGMKAPLTRSSGGGVPGVGNQDTVPAMLTPGEFVVNKESAKHIGYKQLGRLNKYGKGGVVGGGQIFYGQADEDAKRIITRHYFKERVYTEPGFKKKYGESAGHYQPRGMGGRFRSLYGAEKVSRPQGVILGAPGAEYIDKSEVEKINDRLSILAKKQKMEADLRAKSIQNMSKEERQRRLVEYDRIAGIKQRTQLEKQFYLNKQRTLESRYQAEEKRLHDFGQAVDVAAKHNRIAVQEKLRAEKVSPVKGAFLGMSRTEFEPRFIDRTFGYKGLARKGTIMPPEVQQYFKSMERDQIVRKRAARIARIRAIQTPLRAVGRGFETYRGWDRRISERFGGRGGIAAGIGSVALGQLSQTEAVRGTKMEAGLGALSAGLGVGATVGMVGGPIAGIVAGVGMAAVSFIRNLNKMSDELRENELNKVLSDVIDQFKDFEQTGKITPALETALLASAKSRRATIGYREEESTVVGTGTTMVGFGSGMVADEKTFKRLFFPTREEFEKQQMREAELSQQTQKFLVDSIQKGVDLEQQFSPAAYRELIRQAGSSLVKSSQIEEGKDPRALQLAVGEQWLRMEKARDEMNKSVLGIQDSLTIFSNSVQKASQVFDGLLVNVQNVAQGMSILAGIGTGKIGGFAVQGQAGMLQRGMADPRQYDRIIDALTLQTVPSGMAQLPGFRQAGQMAKDYNRMRAALPDILTTVAGKTRGPAEVQTIIPEIRTQLERVGVSREMSLQAVNILDNMFTKRGRNISELGRLEPEQRRQTVDNILKHFKPIADFMVKLAEQQSAFINKINSLQQQRIQLEDRFNADLSKIITVQTRQRTRRNQELRRRGIDVQFDPREAIVPFARQQQLLTGRAGMQNLDAATLGRDLRFYSEGLNRARISLQELETSGTASAGQLLTASQEILYFQKKTRDARQALENLVNSTNLLANVQERLQQLQRAGETRFGLAARFFTADPQGRRQLIQELRAAFMVRQRGGLGGLTPQAQAMAVRGLQATGNLRFGPGRMTNLGFLRQILPQELGGFFGRLGGGEEDTREEQRLRNFMAAIEGQQLKGAQILAQSSSVVLNTFVVNLSQLQRNFFIKLGEMFRAFLGQRGRVGLAGGGMAPRGTDTVPAMLTPGEFVVNRGATKRNLAMLQAINSGKVQYAANGGYILSTQELGTAVKSNLQRLAMSPYQDKVKLGPKGLTPSALLNQTKGMSGLEMFKNVFPRLFKSASIIKQLELATQKALIAKGGKRAKADWGKLYRSPQAFVNIASKYIGDKEQYSGLLSQLVELTSTYASDQPKMARAAMMLLGRRLFGQAVTFGRAARARGFATGGLVPGMGTADSIPASLTPGEFVLNRSAVRKTGVNKLKKMNRGGYLQAGGVVGANNDITLNTQLFDQFESTITKFSDVAIPLTTAMNSATGPMTQLANALNAMPHTIEMTAQHTVHVDITGGEVLSTIEPTLQKLVTNTIDQRLRTYVDNLESGQSHHMALQG